MSGLGVLGWTAETHPCVQPGMHPSMCADGDGEGVLV